MIQIGRGQNPDCDRSSRRFGPLSLRLSMDVEDILRPVVRGLLQGVHGRESALAAPFVETRFCTCTGIWIRPSTVKRLMRARIPW